ncbi:hypothetical protein P4050_16550 [Pseudomonas aeruginosa]|nr:hypothetical protein [Pseudomonas aeruginosa]
MTLGAVAGYWIDRSLFVRGPPARMLGQPGGQCLAAPRADRAGLHPRPDAGV